MRLFASVLALSLLLPVTASAGGLPSAFDPHVFAIAVCEAGKPYNGSDCRGTYLEQTQANPEGTRWYFSTFSTGTTGFWYNFILFDAPWPGTPTPGVHQYALRGSNGTESVPPGLYLEVNVVAGGVRDYGVFAPTTAPEPATLLLVGSGIAGVGALRRRWKRSI